MIEDWIDVLCKVWTISGDGFQAVKSYAMIENAEFPKAIDPSTLALQPVAVTIPTNMRPKVSKGSKHITWYGRTIFHVAPDMDMGRVPSLMPWYGRILRAAALHVQLSGVPAGIDIGNFVILDRDDGITGPRSVQHDNEDAHWGFIVLWSVEESLNGSQLPVSG